MAAKFKMHDKVTLLRIISEIPVGTTGIVMQEPTKIGRNYYYTLSFTAYPSQVVQEKDIKLAEETEEVSNLPIDTESLEVYVQKRIKAEMQEFAKRCILENIDVVVITKITLLTESDLEELIANG